MGALVRHTPDAVGPPWDAATRDADPAVRRRAAELAPRLPAASATRVAGLLLDADPLVAETAAWAGGEVRWSPADRSAIVAGLAVAAGHPDPLVREAAVAALGALGDPEGLPAILTACRDKPPVRRRAVLALAPFNGPEVEAALAAAHDDRDWQVRQAAEDLDVGGGGS